MQTDSIPFWITGKQFSRLSQAQFDKVRIFSKAESGAFIRFIQVVQK